MRKWKRNTFSSQNTLALEAFLFNDPAQLLLNRYNFEWAYFSNEHEVQLFSVNRWDREPFNKYSPRYFHQEKSIQGLCDWLVPGPVSLSIEARGNSVFSKIWCARCTFVGELKEKLPNKATKFVLFFSSLGTSWLFDLKINSYGNISAETHFHGEVGQTWLNSTVSEDVHLQKFTLFY